MTYFGSFQRMSLDNGLMIELKDLEATVESNVKVIEDAFNKLEVEANNWEVKRRGIVKAGTKYVMKILQAKEKVSHINFLFFLQSACVRGQKEIIIFTKFSTRGVLPHSRKIINIFSTF